MKEYLPLEDGNRGLSEVERLRLRHTFLENQGLQAPSSIPLPADCSGRRYFRLTNALLMDAPPPHESTTQFQLIAEILKEAGLSVPTIYAADHTHGFLLIEDFGDLPYRKAIHQGLSEKLLYEEAIKALVHFHSGLLRYALNDGNERHCEASQEPKQPSHLKTLPIYTLDLFIKNAALFLEWNDSSFTQSAEADFKALWQEAYLNQPILPTTLAMRDVMIDNLMWLPERKEFKRCGFIDFQDGALAPITYDIVSLLEDARWDINPAFALEMLDIYFESFPHLPRDDFWASYCLWGAQRTVRIMGVFFRQAKRNGRDHYLAHLPRLWKTLERDLSHPSLRELRKWFVTHGGLK